MQSSRKISQFLGLSRKLSALPRQRVGGHLAGTNLRVAVYRQLSKNREISMNLTRMMLTGAMLMAVPSMALAQQSLTGTVTTIDRINGTIAVRQTPSGTVGANGGGATEQQFKAPGGMLDTVHAGDKITFTASEAGGKKTITKMDKQ
jgi:Cu/Ag efflux protein CusF